MQGSAFNSVDEEDDWFPGSDTTIEDDNVVSEIAPVFLVGGAKPASTVSCIP